jgi:fatty-acyl-CoA synthase
VNDFPLHSLADIEALEAVPIEDRLAGLDSTYDVLRRAARLRPDSTALVFVPDGDSTRPAIEWSYADLLARVTQAANAFHRLGVGPGDVVSYVLPNLPETHATIWGAQAAGAVNAVNPLLEPAHIAHVLNAVECRVLVTQGPTANPALWARIEQVRPLVPSLRTVLVVGEDAPLAADVLPFNAVLDAEPADRLVSGRVIARGEIASCFHTGGTTGLPKVARHTHLNELANAWSVAAVGGVVPGDTLLCGLPLFHVNGVVVTGLVPFMVGARVVLLGADGFRSKSTIAHFWRNVARWKASFFSAVPTVYSTLLATPIDGADVSSLRYALCGAAAMPPELIRRFEEATGLRILEGYGLTEGTCVSAVNPRDGERRNGSVGFRLPYQQMKAVVLGDDGGYVRDCGVDEIGRLVIRGANVFPGYRDERANRGIWIQEGWLDTGDLARIDAEGRVWLTGRQKDLIIRGGHNIDPSMIEEAMVAHPAVALAAAVGKPDAYAGELPVVYVTLRPGAVATPEELLAHARALIPERAAVPGEVIVRDSLPQTAVGKIFKPDLRNDAAGRVLGAALATELGVPAEVQVTSDAKHGTLARVRLAGPPAAEAVARTVLDRYAVRYEISREETTT